MAVNLKEWPNSEECPPLHNPADNVPEIDTHGTLSSHHVRIARRVAILAASAPTEPFDVVVLSYC